MTTPQQWLRPELLALHAYNVPDAGNAIKLDAMENPNAWPGALPADLQQVWLQRLRQAQVNRYPDAGAKALTARLRTWLDLPDEFGLLLGNGSDELIQILAMAVARGSQDERRTLLAPEPGFVMYRMIAEFVGMDYCGVPLADDFALDLPAMLAAIERTQPALIFLAYPNNPTGNLFDRAAIEQIIAAAPGVVVVDEAYAAFANDSFLPDLGRFPNLLVMRTLSKLGLAGLRLGLLLGPQDWIVELNKLRLPYNINQLTQLTAEFAIEHVAALSAQAADICTERAALSAQLAALPVHVWPSQANFLLARMPAGTAAPLHAALRDAGVLVKNLHGAHPQLADCLRVTVGLPEENRQFIKLLTAFLVENHA